jgi:hypothetical protein
MIPGCDHFSATFNLCDKFNRRLNSKSWPRRCNTAEGQQHNFLLTLILVNVYHAFLDSQHIDPQNLDYQTYGLELADELYMYAHTL